MNILKGDSSISKRRLVQNRLMLLWIFLKEPWNSFTVAQIKDKAGIKAHNYVYETLQRCIEADLITKTKQGNTNVYTLHTDTPNLHYFAFVEELVAHLRLPNKVLQTITSYIPSPHYTLVVGGSYAKGTQTDGSDLDVALLIPDTHEKHPYKAALKQGDRSLPEVHGHVFTKTEFRGMLINKEFNFGKELARDHLIWYGAQAYYKILFEAMQHGFQG